MAIRSISSGYTKNTFVFHSGTIYRENLPAGISVVANNSALSATSSTDGSSVFQPCEPCLYLMTWFNPVVSGVVDGSNVTVEPLRSFCPAIAFEGGGFVPSDSGGSVTLAMDANVLLSSNQEPYGWLVAECTSSTRDQFSGGSVHEGASLTISGRYLTTGVSHPAYAIVPLAVKISQVTLDRQGGSGGTSAITAHYKKPMPAITVPTRAGYVFGGYFAGTDGSGIRYYNADGTSASDWDKAQDTTIYAKWTPAEYLVVLDSNGGSIADGTNAFVRRAYHAAYGTLPTPTRAGYTFAGWWTAATGGTQIASSTIVTQTSDHVIYAHWTLVPVTSTLVFNAAGGTVSPDSMQITSGTAYGTLPTPTRAGCTFAGWYTEMSGGSLVTSSTVAGTDDVVVYARWSVSACVVIFAGNGGTPSEASRSYLTGFAYGSLPSAARSGRAFAGWWTESDGGTRVTAATAASAGTLYAHWSERQSVTGIF